jgi:hypothetical protein
MSLTARSTRLPWLRAGLLGPLPLLLPFAWVLDSSSCGAPGGATVRTPMTGAQLLGQFDLAAAAVPGVVLLVSALTPWLARRVVEPARRFWVHALGLVAAALAAYGSWFALFFTIFSTRDVLPAGLAVLTLFAGGVLDALTRLGLAAREWRLDRRSGRVA